MGYSFMIRKIISQIGWDALPKSFGGTYTTLEIFGNISISSIPENSKVVIRGESFVKILGDVTVFSTDNSIVESWGKSKIIARGQCSVDSFEASNVVASGNSKINAFGNSSVVAQENSVVNLYNESTGIAHDKVSMRAHDQARILYDHREMIPGDKTFSEIEAENLKDFETSLLGD